MFPPQKVYLKKKLIGWGKIPALLFLLDFSIIFLYDLITYEIPPLQKGSCEKFGICPLTLPSPARGEGKHIEI